MSILERSNSVENSENIITISQPSLRLFDAIALIVGLVIGAGIFETPALVAANSNSEFAVLQAWGLGGVISIVGALCYAELATTYPNIGGSYDYLKRAFGQSIAILFAWARMSVIQTGSIALLAFVLGDYASQIFSLGNFSAGIYAALAIALLTALNILGVKHSKRLQNWLTITTILGLLAIIVIGLTLTTGINSASLTPATAAAPRSWGSAMVFVLLSYGGWNEAAHISAEIENYRRNIVRSLLWGASARSRFSKGEASPTTAPVSGTAVPHFTVTVLRCVWLPTLLQFGFHRDWGDRRRSRRGIRYSICHQASSADSIILPNISIPVN